jgi:alanyl-tRNA synthetase
VAPDRLRFDFTHFEAVKPAELARIEEIVNAEIAADAPVRGATTTLTEAKKQGALALFGEKYGDEVRMVSIGGISRELCGGVHLERTGLIRVFKITGEESVAANTRRIIAVTGEAALEVYRDAERKLAAVAGALGAPVAAATEKAEALTAELKGLRKDLDRARSKAAAAGSRDLMAGAETVGGTALVCESLAGADAKALRTAADTVRKEAPSAAVALGTVAGERANLIVALTSDLVDRGLDAVSVIKEIAALVGGGGGGRPDMAQAGGTDAGGLQKALARAREIFREQLAEEGS